MQERRYRTIIFFITALLATLLLAITTTPTSSPQWVLMLLMWGAGMLGIVMVEWSVKREDMKRGLLYGFFQLIAWGCLWFPDLTREYYWLPILGWFFIAALTDWVWETPVEYARRLAKRSKA